MPRGSWIGVATKGCRRSELSLRARKKAKTLAAIRNAASRLFAERGYDGTRTRDIAEAAGIATGTLFNYAPTKEAVVVLVWKERARQAADDGIEAARGLEDPVDIADAVFAPIFSFYGEDKELGRIYLQNAVFLDPRDQEMIRLNASFIGKLGGLLVPCAGSGALHAASNVFAAYYLVVTVFLGGQLPTEAAARAMFRQLVRSQADGWAR